MKNKKGFTLIELIVVIVIIGILAAIAIPRFMGAQNRARIGACAAEVAKMREALGLYEIDYATYAVGNTTDYEAFKAAIVDKKGDAYMTLPDTLNFDPASFNFVGDSITFTITVNARDNNNTVVTGTPDKTSY